MADNHRYEYLQGQAQMCIRDSISTKTLDQRWYTQFRIGSWENGESVVNEGSQFPNDAASVDQFFRQMTPCLLYTSSWNAHFPVGEVPTPLSHLN